MIIMRWDGPDGYWASDDPALLDAAQVHRWISEESYWAPGRPREVMDAAIANSLNIGLYRPDGTQAGYARFVTDYVTFGWLCDVFIATDERGRGLGSFLTRVSVGHPAIRGARQFLATAPERTLYANFGYQDLRPSRRWMERPPQPDPA
jgi:GNAT superfamily N-acetyltransferase